MGRRYSRVVECSGLCLELRVKEVQRIVRTSMGGRMALEILA